ncbi:MAG TPA: peptide chain release factor N(5)-glutamine methyltransferase [Gemmatimonadales bacterium]|nr:peptide chain release factor N(5)-glutamine methyltransferase [Gemmatimonadales bacterium]
MPDTTQPLRALLEEAALRLQAAGIAEPRREARRLWADLQGHSRAEVLPLRDDPVDQSLRARYEAAVLRLAAGEPIQYVTGIAGFRRLTLASDRRALIPRPETEGLVELVLARVSRGRIADIGTGSGCIALSLADEGEFDQVVGVDRSPEALALARENRDRLGLPVEFVEGDLCEPLRGERWDALVSNPPYLTSGEYQGMDRSVRDWEPECALSDGPDGLATTRRLVVQARDVVRTGGLLGLEVDCSRAPAVAGLATEAGWVDVSVYEDLFGRARYVLARRSETA